MDTTQTILGLLREELLHWLPVPQRLATAIDGLRLTRIDRQESP